MHRPSNTNHWIEGYSSPSISKEWVKTVFGVYVAANPIDAGTANSRRWKKFTAALYRYTRLKFRKDIKYPEITFVDDDPSQEYTQSKPSLRTRMEGKLGHPVQDGFVQIGRGFVHTFGGRRDFVFPLLPEGLSPFLNNLIVDKFAKDHFVARGMSCEITIDEYGVMFSCPTRELLPNGFGRKVDEWGSADFFVKTRSAFVEHVNRELEKVGSSAYYEV